MAAPAAQVAAAIAANVPPPVVQLPIPPIPQPEYQLVLGDVNVVDTPLLTETETIRQILHWIGFNIAVNRTNLMNESIGTLDDVLSLNQKDVLSFNTDWSSRTVANGRFNIGTRRLKLLQAFVHWVQDFQRVSGTVSIVGLNQHTFMVQLRRALARADIRKSLKDNSSTASDAATPGPLDSERKWKQWEEKFINYTRAHLGSNGIPLAYVIRENEAPNTDGTFTDFITETIECAPLEGEFYLADRLLVFNMLISFTTGLPSGDWIKNTTKHSDGRRSMQALRDHFAGEGNQSRNISEADRLKESLHYKSERAMAFETFLTQCQKMFNIYDKEGEPMPEEARIRFLFKTVQHKDLQFAISALKARMITEVVTYTQCANHIATAVSELPEYTSKNRNISAVTTGQTPSGGNASGIHRPDGSINTGHIPNWRNLSQADRETVYAERKRLGLTKGKAKEKGARRSNNAEGNRLKQLTEQNKKYKRQIKAFKRSSDASTNDESSNSGDTDAGDQFGGKASKKSKKN